MNRGIQMSMDRVGKSFEKSLPLARKAFFVCGKLIGCPAGAPYLGQKKIVHVEKKFLPPHTKVCAVNKPNQQGCRGYIDDQYSSKYNTLSPRISGAMGSSMTKKQGKIRFFQDIETEGVPPDPYFRVNWTQFGGYFFFIATSLTKMFSQSGIDPPNYRGRQG